MMGLWMVLTAVSVAAPKGGGPPEFAASLRGCFDDPQVAYQGTLVIEGAAGPARRVLERYLPPGRYRREILDGKGAPLLVAVQDPEHQWVHDLPRGKVWTGPASGPPGPLGAYLDFDYLSDEYAVAVSTGGRVAGRSTWRLSIASRKEGRLIRSIWVDREHGIPLKTESFWPDGTPSARVRFSKLDFAARPDPALFPASAPAGPVPQDRLAPPADALSAARRESGLEPRWPSWLPSGFVLESLAVMPHGKRRILHYRFTDGATAVSLFQCPPRVRLDFGGAAKRVVRFDSRRATASWGSEGTVLSWSADPSRFILVGPFSIEALRRIAETLL